MAVLRWSCSSTCSVFLVKSALPSHVNHSHTATGLLGFLLLLRYFTSLHLTSLHLACPFLFSALACRDILPQPDSTGSISNLTPAIERAIVLTSGWIPESLNLAQKTPEQRETLRRTDIAQTQKHRSRLSLLPRSSAYWHATDTFACRWPLCAGRFVQDAGGTHNWCWRQ